MHVWLISSPLSVTLLQSRSWRSLCIIYITVAIFCSVLFKQRSLTWSNSSDSRVLRGMFGQATHLWVNERQVQKQNTERRLDQNSNKRLITRAVANGNDVDISSVAWTGNALLTFGNGMDFTPTPTRLPRLSPVTDREPRRTTVFVTMETEQNALSPAKPTQVRVRDGARFGYGFITALIVAWLRRNWLYSIKSHFICAAERWQNWAGFSRAV